MLLILFALTLYYIVKRGVDFCFLAAMSCLLYFYPLVLFDNIVFLADGINKVPVYPPARISIIFGIMFLLVAGLRLPQPRLSSAPVATGRFIHLQARTVAIAVLVLMALVVEKNGFGLNGRDKAEVMANMGYLYKILTLLTAILAAYAFVLKDRVLLVVSLGAVLFGLIFGFRGNLATLISAFFLTRESKGGWKNVTYIVSGVVGVALLVLAKETGYFSRDLGDVLLGLVDSFGSDGWDILSIANPESASISVVYNEVVRQDFSVTFGYLFDAVAALFPLSGALGFDAAGFDTYFKGVLFGAEADSFASGMLSVGYAIAGYAGVAGCFLAIAWLGRIHSKVMAKGKAAQRVLVVAIAGVVLTSFYRSDLIYLLGIVRSLVIIVVALKLLSTAAKFYARPRASATTRPPEDRLPEAGTTGSKE